MDNEGSFTQIMLSDENLRVGLWEEEEVYIPDEAIGMIDIRAPELGNMTGILFQESFDNLDWCSFAILKFAAGFTVALKDHRDSPVEGVKIYTDIKGLSKSRLMVILDGIRVSWERLIWVRSGI